jgi:hypothetical protein
MEVSDTYVAMGGFDIFIEGSDQHSILGCILTRASASQRDLLKTSTVCSIAHQADIQLNTT